MFNSKRIKDLEDEVEFLIEEIAFAESGIDDAFCAIGALLDRVEALEKPVSPAKAPKKRGRPADSKTKKVTTKKD